MIRAFPSTIFNIVKLRRDETFAYQIPRYETGIVPATGTIDVEIEGVAFAGVGQRRVDVWDGEPEGIYVPSGTKARIVCRSETAEVFVAGARFDTTLSPFVVRAADIDKIQYGSDETKTHRKIKHILGTKYRDQVGRLLVSELFTVGRGGWSGFPPHKHDKDRPPIETRHDETTYNFPLPPPPRLRPAAAAGRGGRGWRSVPSPRWFDACYRQGLPSLRRRARLRDVLFHDPRRTQPAAAHPVFPAGLRQSDRDHSRHQGHDREVPVTAATLSEVLGRAAAEKRAVAGLVVLGWEDARAYVEAAEETGVPVILQAGPGCRRHTPTPILGKMFRTLAERSNATVICHIDHATTLAECREGIDSGFSSGMIAGS